MNNYKIEGVGSFHGGEFNELRIEGVGSNKGDIKADQIIIEGVFKSTGTIEAKLIDCEGVFDVYGNIRSQKVNIEGVLTMKDNQKLEAEYLDCEGCLSTAGDLYVDVLKAEGSIKAKGIYGDRIDIDSKGTSFHGIKKVLEKMNLRHSSNASKITTIEATTIYLTGVNAVTVNGHDIVIGPDCVIDTIDCSGTLKVHESSKVNHIIGAKVVDA